MTDLAERQELGPAERGEPPTLTRTGRALAVLLFRTSRASLRVGLAAGATGERLRSLNSGPYRLAAATLADTLGAAIPTEEETGAGQAGETRPHLPPSLSEAVVTAARPVIYRSIAALAVTCIGAGLEQIGKRGETHRHHLARAAAEALTGSSPN